MKAIGRSENRFDVANGVEVHKFDVLSASKKEEVNEWVILINKSITGLKKK